MNTTQLEKNGCMFSLVKSEKPEVVFLKCTVIHQAGRVERKMLLCCIKGNVESSIVGSYTRNVKIPQPRYI